MLNRFLGCDSSFEQADIIITGVPFDGTTSFRPGTRFAPAAMRIDSDGIETYSPYQDKDLTEKQIHDHGDLELPIGNTLKTLDIIEKHTEIILKSDKIPVMIGGEHLVTLPVVRTLLNKHPNLHIIHFDAHTDLREDYLGEKLSHATVMRRIWELTGDKRIHQFGIRSGEKNEFEFAQKHNFISPFSFEGLSETVKKLETLPVYLSIDLDILDPSVLPGTGTPEPGGMIFNQLLHAILSLTPLNIIGADIVELSPHYDNSGISTTVACKILREVLLLI